MTAISNLSELLKTMTPEEIPGEYVFCTVSPEELPPATNITGFFREKEGITIIVEKTEADALCLPYHGIFGRIALTVHSSLTAVGLTAAFSGALGEAGISCNVIAGYYHDHIFVPAPDTERAMHVLQQLQRSAV